MFPIDNLMFKLIDPRPLLHISDAPMRLIKTNQLRVQSNYVFIKSQQLMSVFQLSASESLHIFEVLSELLVFKKGYHTLGYVYIDQLEVQPSVDNFSNPLIFRCLHPLHLPLHLLPRKDQSCECSLSTLEFSKLLQIRSDILAHFHVLSLNLGPKLKCLHQCFDL